MRYHKKIDLRLTEWLKYDREILMGMLYVDDYWEDFTLARQIRTNEENRYGKRNITRGREVQALRKAGDI